MAVLLRAVLPMRVLALAALLALALGALAAEALLREHSPPVAAGRPGAAAGARLPPSARGPVSAAMGAENPSYSVLYAVGALRASNPAQHLDASFTASGVRLSSASSSLALRLDAVGYGASRVALAAATPAARANRVRYARAGLSEWYANGPLGIEQGFTLARAPAGDRTAPLTLSLAIAGSRPALRSGAVTFGHGAGALRYSELTAIDARGHVLPARLALGHAHLLLRIDTRGARFPLRIDPLISSGDKFTGSDVTAPSQLGTSVALSADGNTVIVGGSEDAKLHGAAWVFTRTGSTWTQQGPKLTGGKEEEGEAQFGYSVALSADGNTALIGGYTDKLSNDGAAWVFTRTGSTWTQQGKKLTGGAEEKPGGRFGHSVSLSADGNTALIGANFDRGMHGGAFVFTRAGTSWTQQGPELIGSDEEGEGQFGFSAALSADGNTALIGGPQDVFAKGAVGAAWVFTRAGTTWTQQGPKLAGSGEEGQGELGTSVSLSADAGTALAGAPGETGGGSAYLFTRSGTSWAQQGAKLKPNDDSSEALFGAAVALSADGSTALIGGPMDMGAKNPEGAAWEFTRSATTWTQQGAKLKGKGQVGEGEFGLGLGLSPDGDTAVIGAPLDGTDVGYAFSFTNPPPAATTAPASSVTFTSATLNGLVAAGASNEAFFEYGGTTAYGSSTIHGALAASPVSRTVATPLSGLPFATTIHYRLIAQNSAGRSVGADQSFTTGVPIGKEPPPLPPRIEAVSQSHATWRVGRHAVSLARHARPPLGTTFSVKLDAAASLSFTFTQRVAGRRVLRRCLAPSARNRHRHACKRTLTRGTLTLPAHPGVNRVLFQGVISHSRTLRPGAYTVLISARSAAGLRSATRSLSFRIVR
ncbi:MAG: hypothetical protein H0X28_08420 [Solirubrobacterales bacterium]|nr:hypothetical protein [Solirubrobacterales bacterium]